MKKGAKSAKGASFQEQHKRNKSKDAHDSEEVSGKTVGSDNVSIIDIVDGYGVTIVEEAVKERKKKRLISKEIPEGEIGDDMIISHVDELCLEFGWSRSQFLDHLRKRFRGVSSRIGLDGDVVLEERSQSGNRARRDRSQFNDPNKAPTAEKNRNDKRIVAFIPEALSFKFGEVRRERKFPNMKAAFESALEDWLDADCTIAPYKSDQRLISDSRLEFQVRVNPDAYRALAVAAASNGMTKRDCVEDAIMRFVQQFSSGM